MWQRLTWEHLGRAATWTVGVIWGTLELAVWGARTPVLVLVGAMILGVEALSLLLQIMRLPPGGGR